MIFFFPPWTGRSSVGHLLRYGGNLLPPWSEGQHWGGGVWAQATLCIPSNHAALAPCAELLFACARQEQCARHGCAWHPWLVVWGRGGGHARWSRAAGHPRPFSAQVWFPFASPVTTGELSFDPRLCRPGRLVSCKPQFCELNLPAGVPVSSGSSLS